MNSLLAPFLVATALVQTSSLPGQQSGFVQQNLKSAKPVVLLSSGRNEPKPFDSEPLEILKQPKTPLESAQPQTFVNPGNLVVEDKELTFVLTKRLLESLGIVRLECLQQLLNAGKQGTLNQPDPLAPELCRRLLEWAGADKFELDAMKAQSGHFSQRKCMVITVQPPIRGAEQMTVDVNLDRRRPEDDEKIAFAITKEIRLGPNMGPPPRTLPIAEPRLGNELRINPLYYTADEPTLASRAGIVLERVRKWIYEGCSQLNKDLQNIQQLNTSATTVGALDDSLRIPLLKELKSRYPGLTTEDFDRFKIGKPRITLRIDAWFKNSSGMKGRGIVL